MILDGEGNLRLSGGSTHRVISVASATTAELRRLAVVDGNSDDGGGIENDGELTIADSMVSNNSASGKGGGIMNLQGSLTLRGSEVRRNSAQSGGGISSDAPLTMIDSIVSDNEASTGGGVSNRAELTATGSLISNNTAEQSGGGIDAEDGNVTIAESEVSGNTAGMAAGGLRSAQGLTMANTTVSENTAEDGCGGGMLIVGWADITNSTVSTNSALGESGCGGGINAVEAPGQVASLRLNLSHVTVADNRAASQGSAIFMKRSDIGPFLPLKIENSIVTGDCAASPDWIGSSGAYNLESPDDTCDFDLRTSQVGVDPEDLALGSLRDNGGPTPTHALGEASAAVDVIPIAACEVNEDQRGVPRPQGSGCDAGAFERDL